MALLLTKGDIFALRAAIQEIHHLRALSIKGDWHLGVLGATKLRKAVGIFHGHFCG